MELVKFGMQAMEHAEISGVEYQQGTLTGDLVKAIVPKHLKTAGTHEGRMSAKAVGSFTIATKSGTVPDVGKQYCRVVQRADGYGYSQRSA
jgi:hypothetical protein